MPIINKQDVSKEAGAAPGLEICLLVSSAQEGGVSCELVSEMSELGSDFDGVLDDSGNAKTLFRARIRQKCTSFPLAGGPAIRR